MSKIISSAKFTFHSVQYGFTFLYYIVICVLAFIEKLLRVLWLWLAPISAIGFILWALIHDYGTPITLALQACIMDGAVVGTLLPALFLGFFGALCVKFLIQQFVNHVMMRRVDLFTAFSNYKPNVRYKLDYLKGVKITSDLDGMTYGNAKQKEKSKREEELAEMEEFMKQYENNK